MIRTETTSKSACSTSAKVAGVVAVTTADSANTTAASADSRSIRQTDASKAQQTAEPETIIHQ
jgi:hypothetical protein